MVRAALAFLLVLATVHGARAETVPVDVELLLAVDISYSMSNRELELQRRGYAEALTSEPVAKAIRSGLHGRIAIAYVEWGNAGAERVVADWTLVKNGADAAAFAARLTRPPSRKRRRTSISSALAFAARSIERNRFAGIRRVIDVSGDGPNNAGDKVLPVRDRVAAKGIVINGLPLMTRDGDTRRFDIASLDAYYRDCVVAGPGSFVVPVRSWEEFPAAVRQKLVLEIGAAPVAKVWQANFHEPERQADCEIGEKQWRIFRRYWSFP